MTATKARVSRPVGDSPASLELHGICHEAEWLAERVRDFLNGHLNGRCRCAFCKWAAANDYFVPEDVTALWVNLRAATLIESSMPADTATVDQMRAEALAEM